MIVMSLPVIAAMLLGQTPSLNHDTRCGSYCLYVALEALGYPAMTLEQLEKALGPPSGKGYSMTQLSDHAARVGASTLAVETTVDRLMRRPRPFVCIAVLSRGDANHYILFQDADDTQVHLIDPPRSFTLPLDTFRQSWTGKALLIARAPLMSEESLPPAGGRGWIAYGLGLLLAAAAIALVVIVAKTRKTASIRPPAAPRTLSLIIAALSFSSGDLPGIRYDDLKMMQPIRFDRGDASDLLLPVSGIVSR